MYYIAYLSYTGLSASTILTYISGLSYTHQLHSLEDNINSFLVGKLLEGLRRKKPQKSDIRLPISISLLKRLIQSLSFVCFPLMNRCYLLPHLALVFFAFLRIGEIASDNKSQSGDHVMLISDISFHKNKGDEELYVTIRSSKTDQPSLSSNLIICKQGDEFTGTCFIQKIYAPPLPYFKVNICPFPLPHFASIFFAHL